MSSSLEGRLALLRCPVSGGKLSLLAQEQLAALNGAILQGKVVSRGGAAIARPLTGALVSDDGGWMYPVRGDGIFVLLGDEAIAPHAA